MSSGPATGMRIDQFYREYLQPAGYELYRDNGAHARLYRHPSGAILSIGCDDGAFRLSPSRVNVVRKQFARQMARITALQETAASVEAVEARELTMVSLNGVDSAQAATASATRAVTAMECTRCGEMRPLDQFVRIASGKHVQPCMPCRQAKRIETMRRNVALYGVSFAPRNADADAVEVPAAGDAPAAVPVVPADTASEPVETPLRVGRDRVSLTDFLTLVSDQATPSVFVAEHDAFVVLHAQTMLFLLATDGGPGEPLSLQGLAFITKLLCDGARPEQVYGVLYY